MSEMIKINPTQITFFDVKKNITQEEEIYVQNLTEISYEMHLKSINHERYEIFPSQLILQPFQKYKIVVKMKLKQQMKKTTITDFMFLRSEYFDIRVNISLNLHISEQRRNKSTDMDYSQSDNKLMLMERVNYYQTQLDLYRSLNIDQPVKEDQFISKTDQQIKIENLENENKNLNEEISNQQQSSYEFIKKKEQDEINSLQLSKLQDDYNQLIKKSQEMENKLQITQQELTDIKEGDPLIQRLNTKISELKHNEQKLLKENRQMEKSLSEFEESKESGSHASDKPPKYLSEKKSKINDDITKREVEILKRENEILKNSKEEFEKELLLSIGREKQLKNQLSKLQNNSSQLTNEKMTYQVQLIDGLQQELIVIKNKYTSETSQLKEQINQLDRYGQQLDNKCKQYENDLHRLSEKLKKQNNEINEYESTIKLQENKINSQLKEINLIDEQLRDKNNQINLFDVEYDCIKKSNQGRIIEMRHEIEKLMEENKQLENEKIQQKNDFENEYERLQNSQKDNISEIKKSNKKLEEKLQDEIESKQKLSDTYRDKEQILKQKIQEMREAGYSCTKKKNISSELSEEQMLILEKDLQQSQHETKLAQAKLELVEQQLKQKEESNEQNLQHIEKIEKLLDVIKKQNREYEIEINQLNEQNNEGIQKDNRFAHELNELRECMMAIKREKDRVLSRMRDTEEQQIKEGKQAQELVRFVQMLEDSNITLQRQRKELMLDLNQAKADLGKQIELISQERNHIQRQLSEKLIELEDVMISNINFEKMLNKLQENLINSDEKIQLQNEIIIENNEQIKLLNQKKYEDECDQKKVIDFMKNEMLEQQQKFKNKSEIYENQVSMLKDKFQLDLQDITQKLAKKVPSEKIIHELINNSGLLAKKDAQIKNLGIRLTQQNNELLKMKQKNQKNQDIIKQLEDDIPNLLKQTIGTRVYKMSQRLQQCLQGNTQGNNMVNDQTTIQAELQQSRDMIVLETQILSHEQEIDQLKQEVINMKEINQYLQNDLQNHLIEEEKLQETNKKLQQEFRLLQQQFKSEVQQIERINNQQLESQEKSQDIIDQLREAECALKLAKEEIQRQNQAFKIMKSQNQDKNQEIEFIKEQLDISNEELEKYKKLYKEIQRKEINYNELKQKYDNVKQQETKHLEEKQLNQEKMKNLQKDSQRKDILNKDLKDKIDQLAQIDKFEKNQLDEITDLKETIKKLRNEVERKETQIKNLKNKIDQICDDMERTKLDMFNKTQLNIQENKLDSKKQEQIKQSMKKLDTSNQMLLFLIKRVFRDNFMTVQKLKNRLIVQKNQTQTNNIKPDKYLDALNILNMSPDDLQQFIDPLENAKDEIFIDNLTANKILDQFESELNKTEQINLNEIYNQVEAIIQDRIDLEKKIE